jgi:hypothetical protein
MLDSAEPIIENFHDLLDDQKQALLTIAQKQGVQSDQAFAEWLGEAYQQRIPTERLLNPKLVVSRPPLHKPFTAFDVPLLYDEPTSYKGALGNCKYTPTKRPSSKGWNTHFQPQSAQESLLWGSKADERATFSTPFATKRGFGPWSMQQPGS